MRSFKKFRDYALQSHNKSKEKCGGNRDHYHLDPPATAALQQPVVQQQPPSSELDEVSRGLQVCLCRWPLLDPLPFFCWSLRVCVDLISARSLSIFLSFSPRFVQVWCQFSDCFLPFCPPLPPPLPPSLPPSESPVGAQLFFFCCILHWGVGGEKSALMSGRLGIRTVGMDPCSFFQRFGGFSGRFAWCEV